jgi:hypothetical protein
LEILAGDHRAAADLLGLLLHDCNNHCKTRICQIHESPTKIIDDSGNLTASKSKLCLISYSLRSNASRRFLSTKLKL